MGKIEKYKEYNSVLIAFIVFLSVLAFSTWIMGELGFWGEFSESKDTFLYFFSSAAQTMGAIIAIVLTAIYALVTAIRPSDNPAIEPTKRLMFRDTALLGAVYPGLGMIIASLFGVLFVYTTRANILIMFLMAALVVGTAIFSVGNLIYFLFVRGPMYLNPVQLIINDVFHKKEAKEENIDYSIEFTKRIDYSVLAVLYSTNNSESEYLKMSLYIAGEPHDDKIKNLLVNLGGQLEKDVQLCVARLGNENQFYRLVCINLLSSIDWYFIRPNSLQIYPNNLSKPDIIEEKYRKGIISLLCKFIQSVNSEHLDLSIEVIVDFFFKKTVSESKNFNITPGRKQYKNNCELTRKFNKLFVFDTNIYNIFYLCYLDDILKLSETILLKYKYATVEPYFIEYILYELKYANKSKIQIPIMDKIKCISNKLMCLLFIKLFFILHLVSNLNSEEDKILIQKYTTQYFLIMHKLIPILVKDGNKDDIKEKLISCFDFIIQNHNNISPYLVSIIMYELSNIKIIDFKDDIFFERLNLFDEIDFKKSRFSYFDIVFEMFRIPKKSKEIWEEIKKQIESNKNVDEFKYRSFVKGFHFRFDILKKIYPGKKPSDLMNSINKYIKQNEYYDCEYFKAGFEYGRVHDMLRE